MGCEARIKDSLQQVHSWKWSHSTGGRSFFSKALATAAEALVPRPAAVAAKVQNCMKSRRL